MIIILNNNQTKLFTRGNESDRDPFRGCVRDRETSSS